MMDMWLSKKVSLVLSISLQIPAVIITPPDKAINLPSEDVCFELSTEQLDKLLKLQLSINFLILSAVGEAGVVKLVVRDKKNETSNDFASCCW
jgi:hypothetical protein